MEVLKTGKSPRPVSSIPMCVTDSQAWLFGPVSPVVHWDVTCETEIPALRTPLVLSLLE